MHQAVQVLLMLRTLSRFLFPITTISGMGLSLCKSHHWAFDAGLITISEDHQVLVSPRITEQGPTALMLTGIHDRDIWLPAEPKHRPAPEALSWHREQVMQQ